MDEKSQGLCPGCIYSTGSLFEAVVKIRNLSLNLKKKRKCHVSSGTKKFNYLEDRFQIDFQIGLCFQRQKHVLKMLAGLKMNLKSNSNFTVYPGLTLTLTLPQPNIMTRTTKRARTIKRLRRLCQSRLHLRIMRQLEEDDSEEDELDALCAGAFEAAKERRYHQSRGKYRRSTVDVFEADLAWLGDDTSGEDRHWQTDDEFRQKYRLSKESFKELVGLIKDDPVFVKKGRGRRQKPPAYQLAVLLKYMGTEGSGGSNPDMRNLFHIGRGSAEKYQDRAVTAVHNLRSRAYTWPDEDERKIIAARIFKDFNWPNCVGIMDGTLFPLGSEPQTDDAPDYKGRKYQYSITCLIICDDQRLIRYCLCGWPGSAHDERVF